MSPETARMALAALRLHQGPYGAFRDETNAAIAAIEAEITQPVDEMGVRGLLAAKLSCWHRLTEIESAELVALYTSRIAQPTTPFAWAIDSSSRMWFGEHAEQDAKAEAKRCGGTCKAFPLYQA